MKRQSNTEGTITSFNRPSKGSQTDRGWAWIILPATVMTCFLIIGYIKSYGLFIVEFARVYDCSASMASLLQGIQAGVNSITSTITLTWGLRHMSSRQFVVIGGCIYFLGYILGSFAPNIELMIIPHGLVLGVGMGMAMGPAIVITGQYFERWRGLATGLIMAGGSLGGLVLPFMLQYLFEEYGLRGTLLLTGGIMLHLLLFGGLMRPYASNKVKASTENETLLQKTEIPQEEVIDMHVLKISQQNDMLLPLSDLKHKRSISKSNCSINDVLASLSNLATSNSRMDVNDKSYKLIIANRKNNGERDSTSDELMCRKVDNTKLTLIEEIVFLLKNKLLLIMIVSSVLVTPGCFLIGVYIPPHAERLGFSDKELPLLVSIAGGADLVGRVVCSLTADTGWMKNYNRIAIALIITGLSSLLVSFYVDFISMAVFACVYGVFGGIYFVLFPVVLVDFIGLERFPASLGIINLVHGVSVGISMPILAGIGVTFLMIGNIKSFGIFFVAFIEEYGANASMTSSLQGIQFGIYSFSSLFVLTLVVSRIDHRTAVCIGGVMSCIGYIVTAFAPNVDFMVLSQGVILGIANSLILGPTLVLVGKYFDKRRGLANGLVMSGGSLGALLLPMLLRYILDEYGLRGSLIIIGGLSLNNLVSAALLREPTFYSNTIDTDSDKLYIKYDTEPTNDGTDNEKKAFLENNHLGLDVHEMNDRRRNLDDVASNSNLSVYELQSNVLCTSIASLPVLEDVHASRQNMQGTTETRETSAGRCHSLKDKLTQFMKHAIFRNPLLYIALQGGMLICPGALSMIFLPPHAKDLEINDKNIALLMSIVGGMDFIGRVIYSLLSEIKCIQRYQFLAISAIMSGVLSNSVRLFTEFWSLSIFAVVYGLIGGGYYVLYASVLVDFLGIDNLPLTLGLLSVIHGLSLSAFLPLLGSLRDATGSYYVTYHVAGFAAISGGSLFFILKPLATRWNENHHLQNVNSKDNDL